MTQKKKSISELEVSAFIKLTDKMPKQVNLLSLLRQIQKDQEHIKLVEEIASINSKEKRDKLKKNLIGIVPASLMNGGRTKAHVVSTNPIVFIDIDNLGDEEKVKECYNKLNTKFKKHLIYLGYSASKKGIHMLVYIQDTSKFKAHEDAIHDDIRTLGFEPDKSTLSSIQRMFIGHTHTAIINDNVVPYSKKLKEKSAKTPAIIPIDEETREKVEAYIALIEERKVDITKERSIWVKLAFSLSTFGESGRKYFHQISQYYPDYNSKESNKLFTDCLKRFCQKSTKIGTFFHYCHQAGISISKSNDSDKKSTIERYEDFLRNFDLRFNLVTNRPEMKDQESGKYVPLERRDLNSLFRKSWHNKTRIPQHTLEALIESDFVPLYNPFTNYFENLPPWDGKDYLSELLDTVKTTNDNLWYKFASKWLVAMVASALEDKIINHTVLVLVGKQGIGKTSWIEKLIPKELESYVFSGDLNPSNKDSVINMAECILLIMDELETLNKTQLGSLKAMITMQSIRLRRPYGIYSNFMPHRCSFAASINDSEFLRDATGNRRWLCYEAKSIDYLHDIDMNKVYSQLLHIYKNGFKYWLNSNEIEELTLYNEQFASKTMEEEIILRYFKPCERKDATFCWNSTRIMEYLSDKIEKFPINQSVRNNIGRALSNNGFTKVKSQGLKTWALKEIPEEEKTNINYAKYLEKEKELRELEKETKKEVKKKLKARKVNEQEMNEFPAFDGT